MPIQQASAGDAMIWRRGLVSFVAVVIAITAPVVAASAATAPGGRVREPCAHG
jgi:hypothetical protein